MDPRLVRQAERQHGLLTRSQLSAVGLSANAIKHRQRTRRLRQIRPGVYVVLGSPPTWTQGLLAVVLGVEGAVASHASAAHLLGLRIDLGPYEVTTVRPRRVRLEGVRAHRSLLWLPEDGRARNGVPATSAARLAVDLSGRLDARRLGGLVDELLRRRLLRLPDLARTNGRLAAARGRRPTVVDEVLRAGGRGYEVGDSNLEAKVIRSLAAAGLPAPTAQHWVRLAGLRYRVDLAYPAIRLAVEIDSWEYHRWRSSFDGDRARRNELTLAGYTVLQVTDGMSSAAIVEVFAAALAALGHPGAPAPAASSQRTA